VIYFLGGLLLGIILAYYIRPFYEKLKDDLNKEIY